MLKPMYYLLYTTTCAHLYEVDGRGNAKYFGKRGRTPEDIPDVPLILDPVLASGGGVKVLKTDEEITLELLSVSKETNP